MEVEGQWAAEILLALEDGACFSKETLHAFLGFSSAQVLVPYVHLEFGQQCECSIAKSIPELRKSVAEDAEEPLA